MSDGLMRILFWGVALIALGAPAAAQDADVPMEEMPAEEMPMEEAPTEEAMPEVPSSDAPIEEAPVEEEPAPAPKGAPATRVRGAEAPPPANQLAVQALLDSNPKTPAELFRIIALLVELKRPDAAVPLVNRFLKANPSPRDLSAILREHGSAGLLRIARGDVLGEPGKKMIDLVQSGSRAYARDPKRIAALIDQLGHRAAEVRQQAVADLASGEEVAAAALLARLADPAAIPLHGAIETALASMHGISTPLLTAATASKDDRVAIAAIRVLGRIGDRAAAPYLAGQAISASAARRNAAIAALGARVGVRPTVEEAERLLAAEAEAHLARTIRLPTHGDEQVTVWTWDDAKRQAIGRTFHADDAPGIVAARLARDLFAARPNSKAYQRLAVLASLEGAKLSTGLDAPLPTGSSELTAAAKQGGAILNEALAAALDKRYIAAAIGALQAIAATADASLVQGVGQQVSPLVRAVRDPNRRIRFAALDAILTLAPQRPYAGSSSVVDALSYFIASAGRSRVLVIEPRAEKAQSLAGLLREEGFDADFAMIGRSGRVLLNTSADYEFALVSMGIDNPQIYDLLGQFRRDPRTAQLPIGLLSLDGKIEAARRVAAAFPAVIALAEPQDRATAAYQAEQLMALQGRHAVSPQVRELQAEAAAAHLAKIASRPGAIYDLSRCQSQAVAAMEAANLAPAAADVLGGLGTHTAQKTLVDFASTHLRPLAARQAAAAAFSKSVPRHGLQLTRSEILQQYERYNATRDMDVATQKVLGSILDAIEAPSKAAGVKKAPAKEASLVQ